MISLSSRRIVVRDLGSTNGTYVDERRIEEEGTVEDKSEFRVGSTRIMLVVSDDE